MRASHAGLMILAAGAVAAAAMAATPIAQATDADTQSFYWSLNWASSSMPRRTPSRPETPSATSWPRAAPTM